MNLKLNMHKIFLALLAVFFLLSVPVGALVEIYPQSQDLSNHSDSYIDFNVTISGVNNVYGFQFDLSYDPSIFDSPNVTNGTFLNRNGQDEDYCISANTSTPGFIDNFACSRTGPGSVSGSGVLAKVRLNLKKLATLPSTGDFILSGVKISDINSQPLDNSSENGNATVYECLYGETGSCPGGTKTCGSNNQWGECVVTPGNGGNGDNGGPPGGPAIITPPEPEEEEEEEYYYTADLNKDGCVDIDDISLIALNFGLESGFDQRADMNIDGKIDIMDLALAALAFGKGDKC
jgi:hypothetical protein